MSKSTYAATANEPQPAKRYPSDCTDTEWSIIAPFTAKPDGSGRKRSVTLREVVNAIFYRTKTGCQWRMLAKDFPDWRHVWYYYDKWTEDGSWERINDALRKQVRRSQGRDGEPSLGIIDSQSVKATEVGGERGYDGGKQIKGRKRHILVDILGLLLIIFVHAADIPDSEGADTLFRTAQRKCPRLAACRREPISLRHERSAGQPISTFVRGIADGTRLPIVCAQLSAPIDPYAASRAEPLTCYRIGSGALSPGAGYASAKARTPNRPGTTRQRRLARRAARTAEIRAPL